MAYQNSGCFNNAQLSNNLGLLKSRSYQHLFKLPSVLAFTLSDSLSDSQFRTSPSAIIYLYVGFSLSADDEDEFNAESTHPKSNRNVFDEQQGSVDDESSNISSKLASAESTSVQKSPNETANHGLTLEILESWRLEAVDGIEDTKIDETSAEQIKLKETRMHILTNNNQMNINCPKSDFEFVIIVQGKAFNTTSRDLSPTFR